MTTDHETSSTTPTNPTGADIAGVPVPETRHQRVPATRASRAWVSVLPSMAVLAVGLVFVLQNTHRARISFFTASGTIPLAVALFASFALGAVTVLLLGSIRILQLRKAVRSTEQR
ncbi:MAG: lipopolysaccharide assembly LapA domain-containing protein [Acidimicrobiia bacterium]